MSDVKCRNFFFRMEEAYCTSLKRGCLLSPSVAYSNLPPWQAAAAAARCTYSLMATLAVLQLCSFFFPPPSRSNSQPIVNDGLIAFPLSPFQTQDENAVKGQAIEYYSIQCQIICTKIKKVFVKVHN